MSRRKKNQGGAVLLELLIGIVLTALLGWIVFSAMSTALLSWKTGSSRMEALHTARYAVDAMVRELRYADGYILESPTRLVFRNRKLGGTAGNSYCFFLNPANNRLYRMGVSPYSSPQPLSGANVAGASSVELFAPDNQLFVLMGAGTLSIQLKAVDRVTGQTVTVRTAVTGMMNYLK